MFLEVLLIFLLLRHLRKTVRNSSTATEWDRSLTLSLYAVVVLFILQEILKIEKEAALVWHLLFIFVVISTFKVPEFTEARPVMLAALPLAILLLLSGFLELLAHSFYAEIEGYFKFAFAVAITWMAAMLLRSNKQQKAIEKERKKTREEEDRNKFMIMQKAELELLVAERTSEILNQKNELQQALTELQSTQKQLIQAEKMASLGELTAGIAHEIQNPLNFVNNFSEINTELIDEMQEEIQKGNFTEVNALVNDIKDNEKKILYHGKRADAIVKSMLQHSRSSSGLKEPTDINALADEYLRLAYHGLRAKDKTFNATMHTNFDQGIGKINIIPQDIGRVLLNLFINAFYAVAQRNALENSVKGGALPPDYKPTVTVTTEALQFLPGNGGPGVQIHVKDNGPGIPQTVLEKIYQPFFTTKPTGQGTGLGLSLSYDIIKAHGGEIKIETVEGEGAEFTIQLPIGV